MGCSSSRGSSSWPTAPFTRTCRPRATATRPRWRARRRAYRTCSERREARCSPAARSRSPGWSATSAKSTPRSSRSASSSASTAASTRSTSTRPRTSSHDARMVGSARRRSVVRSTEYRCVPLRHRTIVGHARARLPRSQTLLGRHASRALRAARARALLQLLRLLWRGRGLRPLS